MPPLGLIARGKGVCNRVVGALYARAFLNLLRLARTLSTRTNAFSGFSCGALNSCISDFSHNGTEKMGDGGGMEGATYNCRGKLTNACWAFLPRKSRNAQKGTVQGLPYRT